MWFHQHFNTGTTPARYLAFKQEGVAIRNAQGVPKAWISKRLGGDQIDYADEALLRHRHLKGFELDAPGAARPRADTGLTGEAGPALMDLVERGVIRLFDLLVVRKSDDGAVDVIELEPAVIEANRIRSVRARADRRPARCRRGVSRRPLRKARPGA
mgnify:CR=1 FL=1